MNRMIKRLANLLMAGALAACGGGGGSSGATPGGGETPGETPVSVDSMIYTLSKPVIENSGSDASLLTVTALDANNNPVSGAAVTVSVSSGVYTPVSTTTDAAGQVSGNITIGANKANRNITATIRLGGQTATAVVAVTGSQIGITPLPATPAPGASMKVDLKVTDANGAPIPGTVVTLSGTLGLSGTVTTDATGSATATVAAVPSTPDTYTVNASALGVQASRSVQVVGSTGSGIPNAVGTISSASLALVPNTIPPNTSGSTASRAVLRARFLNPQNQAVQNVRVRFEILPPALGSGEQLSTAAATVYSDVNGEATADYIAGTRSSPTDGVRIRACYGATDAAIADGACPNVVTGTLTVASQPLSITLGDNNLLARGNSDLTYIKKFDVAVADAAGNAVADATVSASVDITQYSKGTFAGARLNCVNEDTNRNGSIDTGEDRNGNNMLEPRKADVILSFLGSNTTGATGRMTIQVEYPQNVATWLRYTVRVTTNVAGSEGTDTKSYVTSFIEGDDKNGSFLTAPYGSVLDCTDPD